MHSPLNSECQGVLLFLVANQCAATRIKWLGEVAEAQWGNPRPIRIGSHADELMAIFGISTDVSRLSRQLVSLVGNCGKGTPMHRSVRSSFGTMLGDGPGMQPVALPLLLQSSEHAEPSACCASVKKYWIYCGAFPFQMSISIFISISKFVGAGKCACSPAYRSAGGLSTAVACL